ncbi:hypothetical protein EJ04DRAFT_523851 [Polyplosphaeria fusca]|uniref:Endonuclease/exonuclease/phosphatase domain-containing protein n=1 Tax=Polyplosphaeria fusca TaxID=682080 RepID=A0A9P4QUJ4_9PLEO|nr:hypothetical protein EJ04DRAFT_523851 [Polyplosphaeria fusca]
MPPMFSPSNPHSSAIHHHARTTAPPTPLLVAQSSPPNPPPTQASPTQASPIFQTWLHYTDDHWAPFSQKSQVDLNHRAEPFHLITWNVDSSAPSPQPRMSTFLHILQSTTTLSIILLQEVSKEHLAILLSSP